MLILAQQEQSKNPTTGETAFSWNKILELHREEVRTYSVQKLVHVSIMSAGDFLAVFFLNQFNFSVYFN